MTMLQPLISTHSRADLILVQETTNIIFQSFQWPSCAFQSHRSNKTITPAQDGEKQLSLQNIHRHIEKAWPQCDFDCEGPRIWPLDINGVRCTVVVNAFILCTVHEKGLFSAEGWSYTLGRQHSAPYKNLLCKNWLLICVHAYVEVNIYSTCIAPLETCQFDSDIMQFTKYQETE